MATSSTSQKNLRTRVIAGNWKMNLTVPETEAFFLELRSHWAESGVGQGVTGVSVALFPPMLSMAAALKCAQGLPLAVGAQNAHWEKSGAFTGEVSGPMLKEAGVGLVLIGHSERRQFFGETDESVGRRVSSLLNQGFRVMACIGETREERESGKTHAVLTRQLNGIFAKVDAQALSRLEIAYEPVWAIGTGLTATPEQAQETHAFIREHLSKKLGAGVGAGISILYGGSAKPENASELLAQPDIDGLLIGGASLKADSFLKMIAAGVRVANVSGS